MSEAIGEQGWFFQPSHATRPRFRLFCLPYAGGGASIYAAWQRQLPDGVEVWPVQLPGRQSRLSEPPLRSIDAIVEALVPAMLPRLDVPFALFGHSLGALICFELARRLRCRRGPEPTILFTSAHRAPQLRNPNLRYHLLDDPAFLRAVNHLNGIPEPIRQTDDLLSLVIPTLRADFEAAETYHFAGGEPLICSIVAFAGEDDPLVRTEDLLPWREQTSGQFAFHLIPGDHFFINTHSGGVLRIISRAIAQAVEPE